ncbi:MAG: iron-containing alcohol dehydrogenase [Rhizomicrobium sp.]
MVGFGGGSPMDTAKALAVLAVHGGQMPDYKAPHVQDAPGLPIIAIPTTAGTGSEATRFTIITDETTDEKMLCAGLAYLPVAALVDYELTLTKPMRLTADTAIDSLTHAIEAMCPSAPIRSPTRWRWPRCARSRPICGASARIPPTAPSARN